MVVVVVVVVVVVMMAVVVKRVFFSMYVSVDGSGTQVRAGFLSFIGDGRISCYLLACTVKWCH